MSRLPYAQVTLTRRGTPAGDIIALAKMRENRTRPEPTHELHEEYTEAGPATWETLDVGSEAEMYAQLKRRPNGRPRRVAERT
jgi:antitoxin (DNA-binding transcriptional repressor) of toxin-antitoxin stability system